jgi:hypothetical protein
MVSILPNGVRTFHDRSSVSLPTARRLSFFFRYCAYAASRPPQSEAGGDNKRKRFRPHLYEVPAELIAFERPAEQIRHIPKSEETYVPGDFKHVGQIGHPSRCRESSSLTDRSAAPKVLLEHTNKA